MDIKYFDVTLLTNARGALKLHFSGYDLFAYMIPRRCFSEAAVKDTFLPGIYFLTDGSRCHIGTTRNGLFDIMNQTVYAETWWDRVFLFLSDKYRNDESRFPFLESICRKMIEHTESKDWNLMENRLIDSEFHSPIALSTIKHDLAVVQTVLNLFGIDVPETDNATIETATSRKDTVDKTPVPTQASVKDTEGKQSSPRRPNFRFSMCGIKKDHILGCTKDSKGRFKVLDDSHIECRGKRMTLSAAAKEVCGGKSYPATLIFTYNGEPLNDIRTRMENSAVNIAEPNAAKQKAVTKTEKKIENTIIKDDVPMKKGTLFDFDLFPDSEAENIVGFYFDKKYYPTNGFREAYVDIVGALYDYNPILIRGNPSLRGWINENREELMESRMTIRDVKEFRPKIFLKCTFTNDAKWRRLSYLIHLFKLKMSDIKVDVVHA